MAQNQAIPWLSSVLVKLKIDESQFLGKGGEGFIYRFGPDKIIKIYGETTEVYLIQLQKLQKLIKSHNLPYATPEILEIGKIDSTLYTIENRIKGKPLDQIFHNFSEIEQHKILEKYLDAMDAFNAIDLSLFSYGQIIKSKESITASSWQEFLIKKLLQRAQKSESWLKKDVKNYDKKLVLLQEIIKREIDSTSKNLIHCDYYFNQVLVYDLNISSVLDFSIHAVVGDKYLDVASISFLSLDKKISNKFLKYSHDLVIDRYGTIIIKYLDIYGLYYAYYYGDLYEFAPDSYDWCLSILNNEATWNRCGL